MVTTPILPDFTKEGVVLVKALKNGKWETVGEIPAPLSETIEFPEEKETVVKIVEPEVTRIAETFTFSYVLEDLGMEAENCYDTQDVLEFAGRTCYQSFDKPNPATREQKDYLRNILDQQHDSVLEHASATFYITGVSRAFTHELIRHRHLSFSQLSQRFVNEEGANLVIPPAISTLFGPESEEYQSVVKSFKKDLKRYTKLTKKLQEKGLPRKQAREAARGVLPNCTETRIVVTGNFRAWRDFLKKRLSPAADAEIRIVAGQILSELCWIAPDVFDDLVELEC